MIHSTEVLCCSVDVMNKRLGGKNTILKFINKGFKGHTVFMYIIYKVNYFFPQFL